MPHPSIIRQNLQWLDKPQSFDSSQILTAYKMNLTQPYLMYSQKYLPSRSNCMRIKLVCKSCKAHLGFEKYHENYVLKKLRNNHTGHLPFEKQTMNPNVQIQILKARQFTKAALNKQPNNDRHLFSDKQEHNFIFLESQLKQLGYEVIADWSDLPNDRYPKLMMIISPTMRRNFQQFGEIISFDITYNLLRHYNSEGKRYNVGVFCCLDTNSRILITGLVIICQETTVLFAKMFQLFLRIHGDRHPQTIVTDQQLALTAAIENLRERKLYKGIHLLDPWHILRNLRKNLRGTEQQRIKCVRTVRDLMKEKCAKRAQQIMEQLVIDQPHNQHLLLQLLDKAEKVIYLYLPVSFIGINRSTCESVNNIIKSKIQHEATMLNFLKTFYQIDKELEARSMSDILLFLYPIQDSLRDPRIKSVRISVEKKVFQEFLKNYFDSRTLLRVISQQTEDRTGCRIFRLQNTGSKEIIQVKNWICSCKETACTGIPCPHLLICAYQCNQVEYTQFFRKRWLKTIPEERLIQIQRKMRKCSGKLGKLHPKTM